MTVARGDYEMVFAVKFAKVRVCVQYSTVQTDKYKCA